jgi:hypothetical protein
MGADGFTGVFWPEPLWGEMLRQNVSKKAYPKKIILMEIGGTLGRFMIYFAQHFGEEIYFVMICLLIIGYIFQCLVY